MNKKELIGIIGLCLTSITIGFALGVACMDVNIDLSMDNNTLEATKNMINITQNIEERSKYDIDALISHIKELENQCDFSTFTSCANVTHTLIYNGDVYTLYNQTKWLENYEKECS